MRLATPSRLGQIAPLVATLVAGCEWSSFNGAGPDDLAQRASDLASSPDLATATVSVTGHVIFDWYNNRSDIPARNRSIGFVGGAATTTAEDGSFTLAIPPRADGILHADLPGQVSVQRVVHLDGGAPLKVDLRVFDIDTWVGTLAQLHGDIDVFGHGALGIRFVGSSAGGYGARVDGAHGGSFVFDPPDRRTGALSETTRSPGGSLYVPTMAAGKVKIEFLSPEGNAACVDEHAPPGNLYPVEVGTMTEIVLRCP